MSTNRDTNTAEILQDTCVDISVRNFGPISEASIDLRPLTVFVGPSNTGKTYFSTLIYALHGIYAGFSRFPWMSYTLWSFLSAIRLDTADEDILKALERLNTPNRPFTLSDMPMKVSKRIQRRLYNAENFKEGLEHYFDIDAVSELIRDVPSDAHQADPAANRMEVLLKVSAENQNLWGVTMEAFNGSVDIRGQINDDMVLFPAREQETEYDIFDFEELLDMLRDPRESARRHYLPAERSGIMQSHSVIASSLVARSTRAGLGRFPELQTFSGGIADFLQALIRPERRQIKPSSEIDAIADALEAEVLSGKIEVKKHSPEGYPEFRYQAADMATDIRLSRASSMVSELAAFVLFLRDVVRPNDTLIIEEPESHLHPGAQSAMAVALVRLVHAGVRVVVTTHSDWFLEEIGNLLRAGELDALGEEVSDSSILLRKEQIGVWHFEKNAPVKEIPYSRFTGVEPQEYGEIAETLYNRSASLQNQLEIVTQGTEVNDE